MENQEYRPEPYWSAVAQRIGARTGPNVIAGDDEPYYRYKRHRFLRLLNGIPFNGKRVLEVGCGPGGNLLEVLRHKPATLTGADISAEMLKLASGKLNGTGVELVKTDGRRLPFNDQAFDITFTATVLQHNTDNAMFAGLIGEICRVTRTDVYLLERLERRRKGDALCIGRPVSEYRDLCARHGFRLKSVEYINTRASYWAAGTIRKLFNRAGRQEGEPVSRLSKGMQRLVLPFTKTLDRLIPSPTDVGRMHFTRQNPEPAGA